MVVVAMNELSFSQGTSTSDVDLISRFGRVLRAVKERVSERHRSGLSFGTPEVMGHAPTLPGGSRVGQAIRSVSDEVERQVLLCLFDYPRLPCPVPPQFHHEGAPAYGLGHALEARTPAVSLDVPGFQRATLRIDSSRPQVATGEVPNLFGVPIPGEAMSVLRQHLEVLPEYTNPGHHDPSSGRYKSGKAILPGGARRLLNHAVFADNGWWARCEHGFFHRFASEDPTHWNGTTDPDARQVTRTADVPASARTYWDKKKVDGCGCARP